MVKHVDIYNYVWIHCFSLKARVAKNATKCYKLSNTKVVGWATVFRQLCFFEHGSILGYLSP